MKNYKLIKISMILSLALVAVAYNLDFFLSKDKKIKNSVAEINGKKEMIIVEEKKEVEKIEKAYFAKIKKDEIDKKENSFKEESVQVKLIIPKGKRLYDEEKMKEVSEDANIEYVTASDN